jgi:polysaccharide export outer membrane protein
MLFKNVRQAVAAIAVVMVLKVPAAAQQNDYVLGPQDVFTISVWGPGGMSERFTVEADGTFTFPILGRLRAGGLTVRQLQDELTNRLRDGYFNDPRVTVAIEDYKSQRIYVVGEVRSPGTYTLTRSMTLVEALALAGPTDTGGGVAVVRRRTNGKTSSGPVIQGGDGIIENRIDLSALRDGVLADNPFLRDGDTIAVLRAEPIYVSGHVSKPGEYTIGRSATVRQVLALAGGVSQRGAAGRIKIVRVTDGSKKEIKVDMDDLVMPGDTVIVPERYF